MSKRRINKQQATRIKKMQGAYQETHETTDSSALLKGLVIARFGANAEIETDTGLRVNCSLRSNLKHLVAGDRILWLPEGQHQGIIVSVFPRTSVLERTNSRGEKKPIAANITQLVITVAPLPLIAWPLLDSYLIMAEALHLEALIVLNKVDIPCDALQTRLIKEYQPLGYPLLFTEKTKTASYVALKQALNHHVNVFVGQSGVGKSSLIASILPHETNIQTGDIATSTQLGRHTTSNSRYYHLTGSGALIDSPGVREFTLWNIDSLEIAYYYREFKPFLSQCKFRNCNHRKIEGCALMQAVQDGRVSQNRYANYIALCDASKKQNISLLNRQN